MNGSQLLRIYNGMNTSCDSEYFGSAFFLVSCEVDLSHRIVEIWTQKQNVSASWLNCWKIVYFIELYVATNHITKLHSIMPSYLSVDIQFNGERKEFSHLLLIQEGEFQLFGGMSM